MKSYQLFISVYRSVDDMYAAHERDFALNLETVSKIIQVEAEALDEAVEKAQRTQAYEVFQQRHDNINFYYLDEKKHPCQILLHDLNT